MDKNTTNAVRQVLMNELGLTRESVRQMMAEIVKETSDKYMAQLTAVNGPLQTMVRDLLDQRRYGNTNTLREVVLEQAKLEVKQMLENKLRVSLEPIVPAGAASEAEGNGK